MKRRRQQHSQIRRRSAQLVDDPLFQLNLLIWLSFELSEHPNLTAWLRHQGWEIYSIGLKLPLSQALQARLSELGATRTYVRPDVVFQKGRQYLPTECKRTSFGSDSSTAEQARALLAITGPELVTALALPVGTRIQSTLLYAVPGTQIESMGVTLRKLTAELKRCGIPASDSDVMGIISDKKRISIRIGARLSRFLGLRGTPRKDVEVIKILPGQDPRPLYVIPYDPSIGGESDDPYAIASLQERVHIALVQLIHGAQVGDHVPTSSVRLLSQATMGLSDRWDDTESKKNIYRRIRSWVGLILKKAIDRHPTAYAQEDGEAKIMLQSEDVKKSFEQACESGSPELWDRIGPQERDLFDHSH